MPIDLTLSRILKLLPSTNFPWRALHVAGTNGKGSVCAYLSSALTSSGVRTGRFTSPHLLDRWDSIVLNEKTVDASLFLQIEDQVKKRNKENNIGASEFELLTATAFEIFSKEKVELAVVEVGMGGRLDATNVIKDPLVTVLTKIGLDHTEFLGDTIQKIAREKAGILKAGAPCVVDASNSPDVIDTIRTVAQEVSAGDVILAAPEPVKESSTISDLPVSDSSTKTTSPKAPLPAPMTPTSISITTPSFGVQSFTPSLLGKYQHHNLACAIQALSTLTTSYPQINSSAIKTGVALAKNPGRLQWITIRSSTGRKTEMIVDGAHNPEAAESLAEYVDETLRGKQTHVTWVVGISDGKDVKSILKEFLREGDVVSTVAFGKVDGMPWVKATDTNVLKQEAESIVGTKGLVRSWGEDLKGALQWSCEVGCEGPIVIAGSLYLAGDVTRLSRSL